MIIADSQKGKRFSIDREDLLDILEGQMNGDGHSSVASLQEIDLFSNSMDKETPKNIEHWHNRRWSRSVDFYLWSRQCNHLEDECDESGEIRREVLQQYLEKETAPSRIRPAGVEVQLTKEGNLSEKDSLGEIFFSRRSVREFIEEPVTFEKFSSILWWGLNTVRGTRVKQACDENIINLLLSYGIGYDYYLVIYSVEGIAPGIYYYDIFNHSLIEINKGEFKKEVSEILVEQRAPETAAWTLFLVADFDQYQWLYRHERAFRNLLIEAGRIATPLVFVGQMYKIGTLLTPAIMDKSAAALLHLNEVRQAALYSLTMGFDPKLAEQE